MQKTTRRGAGDSSLSPHANADGAREDVESPRPNSKNYINDRTAQETDRLLPRKQQTNGNGNGGNAITPLPGTTPSFSTQQPTKAAVKHFRPRIGTWIGPQIPLRPELFAISLVYLVQGLLGLSRLAIFTFFKDDLKLDPATVALLTSLGMAPWVVKPIYGFLSDSVPLWGYRRRSYLVLCGAAGAASWAALAGPVDTASAAVMALVVGSLSTACADVVADSIVVELSRGEPQSTAGSLQSLCWASASGGAILSAYFSGSLVQEYGPRPVFLITAAFPLLVAVAAAVIPEERILNNYSFFTSSQKNNNGSDSTLAGTSSTNNFNPEGTLVAIKTQVSALWSAISQPAIFMPALFVFLWQATPTADTAMLFFETNELGFTPEFLGRIRLVASIASLAGVGVYNFYLKATPLKTMFTWTALIGTGLGLTQLILITRLNRSWGISDEIFALGDSALLTVLGQVSFMPVLVLAARLCPEGVEATLFATLMSILNGGSFVGSALGSILTKMFGVTSTNFDNLAPLVAVCTLSALAPLLVLRMLPDTVDVEKKEAEE
jgi:folate/biopterin transporter